MPYRISIEFPTAPKGPRIDFRDGSFKFARLVCECGRPKEAGYAGCPRCERLGRILYHTSQAVVGSPESRQPDSFEDVRIACTRWLKARGLEPDDPTWFARAVEHFKRRRAARA